MCVSFCVLVSPATMDLLASYAPASVKEQHAREQELKRQQREDDNKAGAGSSKTTNSKTDSKLEDAKTASASETDTKTAEPLPSASASASPSAVAVQEELLEQLPLFHGFDNELVGPAAVAVATASGEGKDLGFYDPARLAKELNILLENHDVLVEEMRAATNWNAWPETNLYKADEGKDWKVVPFLHTFPATDEANSEWVETNCNQCPKTVEMLRKIPGIRTALYSRMYVFRGVLIRSVSSFFVVGIARATWQRVAMCLSLIDGRLTRTEQTMRGGLVLCRSPNTKLTPHTGWADLSNHVIRCHIPLVAEENTSGVWVLGKVQFHSLKPKPQILVRFQPLRGRRHSPPLCRRSMLLRC